jgi:hypothetical protein
MAEKPRTLTLEMVSEAANALEAEGVYPSVRAVREKMGYFGSHNKVLAFVNSWRAEHPESALRPAKTALVPASVRKARETQAALAAAAQAQADLEHAKHVESLESRIAGLEAELRELQAAGRDLVEIKEQLSVLSQGMSRLTDGLDTVEKADPAVSQETIRTAVSEAVASALAGPLNDLAARLLDGLDSRLGSLKSTISRSAPVKRALPDMNLGPKAGPKSGPGGKPKTGRRVEKKD